MMADFYDELLSKEKAGETAPGIMTGTVKANYDKEHPGMVQVEYCMGEKGKNVSGWLPMSMPYTGKDFGVCFLPEIGTEVVIGFHMGNWNRPIVIGSLWNKNNAFPAEVSNEKNTVKSIKTKGGLHILLKEEGDKASVRIFTPKEYELMLDDEHETIRISDKEGKNKIQLDGKNGSLSLLAGKKLELKVEGGPALVFDKNGVKLEGTDINLEAKKGIKINSQTLNLKGSTVELKADASLKINSSGIAEIKGNLVKLN